MVNLQKWVFMSAWWHVPVAYVVGYVVFVISATVIWGFIYRPGAEFGYNHPIQRGVTWSGEQVVQYALAQGLMWPVLVPIYAVFVAIKAIIAALVGTALLAFNGGGVLAKRVAKAIPAQRPHGFQVKR
jgi:hypothetical protein